ncbi:MAG: hypothetical protein WA996_11300 [Candidatus Promineifilaceae bacterium]
MDNIGEIGGLVIGFLLTLCVYSYIVKDNPMYRLAVHILVGVSAGFAAVVVARQVLIPIAESALSPVDRLPIFLWLVPIILSLLLLAKLIPGYEWLGNSSMAVLIAVGSAVGLVGAIVGTLLPQVVAKTESDLLTLVVAGLTICVLAYFHFTGRLTTTGQVKLPVWHKYVGLAGRFVITIALAGVFAGLFSTTLVLLNERLGFYLDSFKELLTG